ncbi:choline transport protein [Elsinoe ampelina]|uniref:Choline transport protein n=1 Tax=Elsinoe ampelina TaxID=302913 RepID=A0A6A6GHY4_9PEZI|nr:choline transport protein [Elsinoe ampelina]
MSASSYEEKAERGGTPDDKTYDNSRQSISVVTREGQIVNASGHKDQLKRQYGLLSVCGLALTIDNAWVALGGSLTVSILNGGPPGILYEFLTACFYYCFIAASVAELASSIPSSGGVYHWASITPGRKWGRTIGYFAGWLNFFGWIFDLASIVSIPANVLVEFYRIYHPELEVQAWHTYVAFLGVTWFGCAICIFANRIIPFIEKFGLFLIIGGGIATIAVVAAVPDTHASSSFVWKDFVNQTGWPNGVAFLTGVLNGAFAIGTVDSVTHLAEELPNPRVDLPKAIGAQMILGTFTGFVYAIAILYAITDLDAVIGSPGAFPLSEVYAQATGSTGGTFGLLLIVFLSIMICVIGTFLTCGRMWWSLARDNATPLPRLFSSVNEGLSCPIPATVFCALLVSGFGAIALGSKVAFADLVGSFIILTSISFLFAIIPNMVTGRKNVPKGWFWMGRWGMLVNGLAVVFTIFFNIMYCFPYAMPVTPDLMNYNSVILVGCFALSLIWWVVHARKNYPGPLIGSMDIKGQ